MWFAFIKIKKKKSTNKFEIPKNLLVTKPTHLELDNGHAQARSANGKTKKKIIWVSQNFCF